jgi:O-antigen ligase
VVGSAVVLVAAAVAAAGGPAHLARRVYDGFSASGPPTADPNARLFNLSGSFRSDLWRAALRQWEAHPLLGDGAGTFHAWWNAHRTIANLDVRNVHNAYFEMLGTLGPLGLALFVGLIGTPLVAAWRARGQALAPALLGALCAYTIHVVADRDWQVTAVTLAWAACAAAALVAARVRRD